MRYKQMNYGAKLLGAEVDQEQNVGRVKALVSVFGNVDFQGDRVVKGAFAEDLERWRERGDPIPWIWSHEWRDLDAHVGWIPSDQIAEVDKGLEVQALMDLSDPPAAKTYNLLKQRRIRQFSFAFDVEEEGPAQDDEQVNELRKLRLYEAGPCLLGANQETELLEVASRPLTPRRSRSKQDVEARLDRLEARVDRLERTVEDGDGESARQPGAKGAIGAHGGATDDRPWDGPAAEAAIPNDAGASVLRRMYAWVDPQGDADSKASYRFIHHRYSGGPGAASVIACTTGIGVLNGGRGGSTIPGSDRQGVYNHLARHIRDSGGDPPELRSLEDIQRAALEEEETQRFIREALEVGA